MINKVRRVKFNLSQRLGFTPSFYKLKYKFTNNIKTLQKVTKINDKFGIVDETIDELIINWKGEKIFLRKKGSDIEVFWQLFFKKEYETVVDAVALNQIEVKNIVDLGSNIGLTSIYFLASFPEAKITALEPDTQNFKQLEKNIAPITDRIKILQKAVWSNNDFVYIHDDFRDSLEWSRTVSNTESSLKIEAITMKSLIEQYQLQTIDLLKIDIEGGEAEIFKSGNDISFLAKTKLIAIEIHDEFNCRDNINEILRKNFVMYSSGELTIGLNKNLLFNISR